MRRFVTRKVVTTATAVAVVGGLLSAVMVTQAAAEPSGKGVLTGGVGEVTPETARARADAVVGANPGVLAMGSSDRLAHARTITDPAGSSHVRYTRTYKGLRVYGGDVVVHNAVDGSLAGASVGLTAPLDLDTTPKITPEAAAGIARQQFTGSLSGPAKASEAPSDDREGIARDPWAGAGVGTPELIVDASSGSGALAYETVVTGVAADGQTPSRLHVFVDALTGAVRGSYDAVQSVNGTGRGIYNGTVPLDVTFYPAGGGNPAVYTLEDPVRPGATTCDFESGEFFCYTAASLSNQFGNGANSDSYSAAADAHYGAAKAFDYFKNVHGRNGMSGDGTGIWSAVHFGFGFDNAFYDPTFWDDGSPALVYGDGPSNDTPYTSLDIVAHEFTHGITDNVVPGGLVYEGESGGLNEATSDIFGTMVEFFANNPNDPGDYILGEEVFGASTPLRFMYDPALDGFGFPCWTPDAASADVHDSSGIANHFFFLLAEGSGSTAFGTSPVCGGAPAVTGIGRDKAAAIWYRALDVYFTSTTSYVDAANPANTVRPYTLAAAGDLYGVCSAEYRAVQEAWTAVSVPGSDAACVTPTAPGAFVSLAPARILDTREGTGASRGKVPAAGQIQLQVSGRGGVPATGVGAVVLNVTVTESTSAGFVTAYPTGEPRPTASNLNYTAGQTIPNLVTVKLGTGGKVTLYNHSTAGAHLIADVAGYYIAGTAVDAGTFTPLSPARLLDTREPIGVPSARKVGALAEIDLQVTGRGGVPAAGVGAVVLNVTVTESTSAGFVTVYPDGAARPTASNLNYTVGQTIPNLVTVKLGTGGKVTLYNHSTAGAHLIADVAGYYLAGTASVPGAFVPLDPTRLLDTRAAVGVPGTSMVAPLSRINLTVTGGVVPGGSTASAVVLNVTVTEPSWEGFITVYPNILVRPLASSLNFSPGQTIPNLTVVKIGGGGRVSLYNGSIGRSHLLADVAGYFRA